LMARGGDALTRKLETDTQSGRTKIKVGKVVLVTTRSKNIDGGVDYKRKVKGIKAPWGTEATQKGGGRKNVQNTRLVCGGTGKPNFG